MYNFVIGILSKAIDGSSSVPFVHCIYALGETDYISISTYLNKNLVKIYLLISMDFPETLLNTISIKYWKGG